MQQHITIEQLNELSKKGKEKLEAWIETKLEPPVKGSAYVGPLSSPQQTCYFMTIGRMIEFITFNTNGIEIKMDDADMVWSIEIGESRRTSYELLDPLWEAVKIIVNE